MLWFCARHDVDVKFPIRINTKCAVKEITEIPEHGTQVIVLRLDKKVGELFDNVIHVHLFILGIQNGGNKAVWVVPVPAKELFFLVMYFKGFRHGEVFVVVQTLWISHGQLTVEPLFSPGAIFNVNATLCQEVGVAIEYKCFVLIDDCSHA
jgi:hypothetical protein